MVLTEFESTTSSIKCIETKIDRVEGYIKVAEEQRDHFAWQADEATALIDDMTDNVNEKSGDALEYMTGTLDRFAYLMEVLETTVSDLQLMSAPRAVQKEMRPLLVPAVVLVFIVTVSNCIFGFLLANDTNLADSLSLEAILGEEPKEDSINVLNIFAIFHVILLGLALFHISFEISRHVCKKKRRQAAKRMTSEMAMRRLQEEMEGMDSHIGEEDEEEEEFCADEEEELSEDERAIPEEPTTLSVSDGPAQASEFAALPLSLPMGPHHKSRPPAPLNDITEDIPAYSSFSEPDAQYGDRPNPARPASVLSSPGATSSQPVPTSPLRAVGVGSYRNSSNSVASDGRGSVGVSGCSPSRRPDRGFAETGMKGSVSGSFKDFSPSMKQMKSMRPDSLSGALRSLGKRAEETMERRQVVKQGVSP